MEKSVEWGFDTYMQEIFQMKEVSPETENSVFVWEIFQPSGSV